MDRLVTGLAAPGLLLLLLLMTTMTSCIPFSCGSDPRLSYVSSDDLDVFSFPIEGSGQGLQVVGEKTYFYGDGETGLIAEFEENEGSLVPTGRTGRLTRDGVDLIPHPTGVAFREGYPTFIGGGGTLYQVDWDLLLEDGNLDRALLRTIADDEARHGSRPEYVFYDGRWYVATADYNALQGNEVRLMDPEKLGSAEATSEAGVVVHRFSISSFVQDLHWSEASGQLVLVQNIRLWKGWKLTAVDIGRAIALNSGEDEAVTKTLCFEGETSELEGFASLPDGRDLLLTADTSDNLFLGSGLSF